MTFFEKIKEKFTIQNIVNILVLGISIYLLVYHFQVKKVINLIDVEDNSIKIKNLESDFIKVDLVNYNNMYGVENGFITAKQIQVSDNIDSNNIQSKIMKSNNILINGKVVRNLKNSNNLVLIPIFPDECNKLLKHKYTLVKTWLQSRKMVPWGDDYNSLTDKQKLNVWSIAVKSDRFGAKYRSINMLSITVLYYYYLIKHIRNNNIIEVFKKIPINKLHETIDFNIIYSNGSMPYYLQKCSYFVWYMLNNTQNTSVNEYIFKHFKKHWDTIYIHDKYFENIYTDNKYSNIYYVLNIDLYESQTQPIKDVCDKIFENIRNINILEQKLIARIDTAINDDSIQTVKEFNNFVYPEEELSEEDSEELSEEDSEELSKEASCACSCENSSEEDSEELSEYARRYHPDDFVKIDFRDPIIEIDKKYPLKPRMISLYWVLNTDIKSMDLMEKIYKYL